MDSDSTSLTNKNTNTCAESVCPMDVASQSQVQNMDTSQDVDVSLDESAELKFTENCSPATENVACNRPADTVTAEPVVPCHSVPTSTDVEMQCGVGEANQRMETGSQETAGDSHEEACSVVEKEINEENTPTCQSLDEIKTTEGGQENEALTDADNAELTGDNKKLFLESSPADHDFMSPGTTPTSGKNISNSSGFSGLCPYLRP